MVVDQEEAKGGDANAQQDVDVTMEGQGSSE